MITGTLSTRLESVTGRERILSSEVDCAKYGMAGSVPAAVARPNSAEEAAEIVRFAAAEKLAVVCCGSRSKLAIGMPPERYDLALDLTDLRQIVHYDPADLTLSVDAGVRLGDLSKVLAAQGQFLPLAVPCFARATVGGTLASGIDSLLRLQYGSARDFLIGAEFVDGKGLLCKSGGRVVKNVTGYDIHKLLIGSLGTLAAITRLNFRTFPVPESRRGVLTSFATAEAALGFRNDLLDSGLLFESLELFDPGFARLLAGNDAGVVEHLPISRWCVYAGCAGNEAVVRRTERELKELAAQSRDTISELLENATNQSLNERLREAFDWLCHSSKCVALLRVVPTQFTASDLECFLKAAGGASQSKVLLVDGCGIALVAFLADEGDSSARNSIEKEIAEWMSHSGDREEMVTLLHAADSFKAQGNVWCSTWPDFVLMQRVKSAFDPHTIFAPGRFVGGI